MFDEGRLPTQFWIDAQCAAVTAAGGAYYIANKGDPHTGMIAVKIYDRLQRACQIYLQQRDFDTGELGWIYALDTNPLAESEVDHYIQQALAADPDLWVVEIEANNLTNPFEGKLLD